MHDWEKHKMKVIALQERGIQGFPMGQWGTIDLNPKVKL
jgi:hypothetical protein